MFTVGAAQAVNRPTGAIRRALVAAGLLVTGLLLTGGAAAAEPDRVDLDASAIRGNQELPRVLYIVPWKDPAMAELAGRPVNSLLDEVLSPVDREVFLRTTRYHEQLQPED